MSLFAVSCVICDHYDPVQNRECSEADVYKVPLDRIASVSKFKTAVKARLTRLGWRVNQKTKDWLCPKHSGDQS